MGYRKKPVSAGVAWDAARVAFSEGRWQTAEDALPNLLRMAEAARLTEAWAVHGGFVNAPVVPPDGMDATDFYRAVVKLKGRIEDSLVNTDVMVARVNGTNGYYHYFSVKPRLFGNRVRQWCWSQYRQDALLFEAAEYPNKRAIQVYLKPRTERSTVVQIVAANRGESRDRIPVEYQTVLFDGERNEYP